MLVNVHNNYKYLATQPVRLTYCRAGEGRGQFIEQSCAYLNYDRLYRSALSAAPYKHRTGPEQSRADYKF